MDKSLFERLLAAKGLKITQPRLAVFKSFDSEYQALTLQEIQNAVSEKVDRVSIYRILQKLTDSNLILRQNDHEGTCFYILNIFADVDSVVTPLLLCSGCYRVFILPDLPASYVKILKKNHSEARPVFNGICKGCYHG